MRKSTSLLVCFALLACLSLKLYAQSADEELDQLELMKQFIGTWQAEVGGDTLLTLTYEPFGNGIIIAQKRQVNGEAFWSAKSIMGVSRDKKNTMGMMVDQNGITSSSFGKFVSSDKNVFEMYRDDLKHPVLIREMTFQSPDVITARYKFRGDNMTWDADWSETRTFYKVK